MEEKLLSVCLDAHVQAVAMQELYVADLDMTGDLSDESYADRPPTKMRVPFPTDVKYGRSSTDEDSIGEDSLTLVQSNKALQVSVIHNLPHS
jgi:hypothetical protein